MFGAQFRFKESIFPSEERVLKQIILNTGFTPKFEKLDEGTIIYDPFRDDYWIILMMEFGKLTTESFLNNSYIYQVTNAAILDLGGLIEYSYDLPFWARESFLLVEKKSKELGLLD